MILRRHNTIKQNGFTLLELLIALTILAFISLFTAETIRSSFQTKMKLQGTMERTDEIRETIRIMDHDINMAFHYRDFRTQIYNAAVGQLQHPPTPTPQQGATNPPGVTPPPTQPNQPPPGVPSQFQLLPAPAQLTGFDGHSHSLYFTTLTRPRVVRDEPTSMQQRVGYFVKNCHLRSDPSKEVKCLWRMTDPYFRLHVERGGTSSPLLEDIRNVRFRYLGENADQWTNTWKTLGGDPSQTDRFPVAVEITLSINNHVKGVGNKVKNEVLKAQTVAAIRFPNNPPPPTTVPGAPTNTPTQNGSGPTPPGTTNNLNNGTNNPPTGGMGTSSPPPPPP